MDGMDFYTVLYYSDEVPNILGTVPLVFQCWADDMEHAEEQCTIAEEEFNPEVAWVYNTADEHPPEDALANWRQYMG